jgi:methylmalonyl-CoA mutase C-terminal domain/subunit
MSESGARDAGSSVVAGGRSGRARARVLLAKPGLDGHDRGIKVIAMALRDAGAEVIYLGLRQSVDDILRAATEEDVDVIGLSVLSGAHLTLGKALLQRRADYGIEATPVVIGGTIPARDARLLTEAGAAAVYPVGTQLTSVVEDVLRLGGHAA